MAHEVAHVAARHGMEQVSKGTLVNYASIPLIFLGGWGGYIVQQVAGLAVPLTFLKFSRGAERKPTGSAHSICGLRVTTRTR